MDAPRKCASRWAFFERVQLVRPFFCFMRSYMYLTDAEISLTKNKHDQIRPPILHCQLCVSLLYKELNKTEVIALNF